MDVGGLEIPGMGKPFGISASIYQVQTGLDTGSPFVESNFAFGMLFKKLAHPKYQIIVLPNITNLPHIILHL